MLLNAKQFPPVHSKASKAWMIFIKGFGIFFSVLTPLLMILLTVELFGSRSINIEIKILFAIIAILISILFIWLLITQARKKQKNKITQVIVDNGGIHHCNEQEVIKTIPYNLLMPNPEGERYDVFLSETVEAAPSLCVYLFDEKINQSVRKAIFFETDVVITNGNSLLTHFLKGIIIFRPDLKIAPNVLDLYQLKEFEGK